MLRLIATAIALFALIPSGRTVRGDELRVGFAEADITPPAGWRLADNYYEHISKGTHDPLRAKAIYLEQGPERAAIVICDLTGVTREFSDRARSLIGERTGIKHRSLVIGATHTHGAPVFYDVRLDLWRAKAIARHGKDPHEPFDYSAMLAERCAEAAEQAKSRATPARLTQGVVKRPGLAFNRRFHMKDGTVRFNPGKLNKDVIRPAGPVDDDLHVLFAKDRDGRALGSLSVFAMHVATFGDDRFGADFPMHLQEKLRERFGREFISIFGEGTAGDVNHVDVTSARPQTSTTEPARIGGLLADTILPALPDFTPVAKPSLAVRSEIVPLPLREVTDEEIARATELLAREGDATPAFMVLVEMNRILDVRDARAKHGANLPAEVGAFRLDSETAIVTLPHEVFVELGQAIKSRSPFRNTFVISLCNGVDFYVPTKKAFAEGSYEVVNSRVKPGAGEILVESASRLLRDLSR